MCKNRFVLKIFDPQKVGDPPPKLVGFYLSLKNFVPQKCLSKNDLVRNNFGQGNKNCMDSVKLRGAEVPLPQKSVGLKLFLIFVTSAHIQNLGPLGHPFTLFVWVGLT